MVPIGDTIFLRSDTQNIFYRRHFFNRHGQFIISKKHFLLQTILFHRQAKNIFYRRLFYRQLTSNNFIKFDSYADNFHIIDKQKYFIRNLDNDKAPAPNMRLKASGALVLI